MPKIDLSNTAYEIILKRIITNEYRPGQMLNELSLHNELGISRTPIHTAMIMLQQEQLVEILPKKGIRVKEITADTIRDTYSFRELIELHSLANYGLTFDKEKIVEYYQIFSEEYSEDYSEKIFHTDVQFHQDIVALCGNELLSSYYASLKNHFIRLTYATGFKRGSRVENSNKEHLLILKSLLNDDVDSAAKQLRGHLRRACETANRVIILKETASIQNEAGVSRQTISNECSPGKETGTLA